MTKHILFKVEIRPDDPDTIHFACDGDPLDQMNMLITAMKGNDHPRCVILAVANLWLESISKEEFNLIYKYLRAKGL